MSESHGLRIRRAVTPEGKCGFELYWPGWVFYLGHIPERVVCFVETEAEAIKAKEWLAYRPDDFNDKEDI